MADDSYELSQTPKFCPEYIQLSSDISSLSQETNETLKAIINLDKSEARNIINYCMLSYRFFISPLQFFETLQILFPLTENPNIWKHWLTHHYVSDILPYAEIKDKLGDFIEKCNLKMPLDRNSSKIFRTRNLGQIVYYSSYDHITSAQQITYYVNKLYKNISVQEFLDNSWSKPGFSINLKCLINHANIFCNSVVQDIILGPVSDKFRYYCLLLQSVIEYRNYFTGYCLCMALQQNHVERISNIRQKLSRIETQEYGYVCSMFDLIGNYRLYRSIVDKLNHNNYIPALPICLKDITFLSLKSPGLKGWIKLGQILSSILTVYEHNIIKRPSLQSIIDTHPILSYKELDELKPHN